MKRAPHGGPAISDLAYEDPGDGRIKAADSELRLLTTVRGPSTIIEKKVLSDRRGEAAPNELPMPV